jgi:hypothetical protein
VIAFLLFAQRGSARISCQSLLLFFAIGPELFEIGPQIIGFLFVLNAGKNHLCPWNLGTRVLDVFLKCGFAPGDTGCLIGIAIVEPFDSAGLTPIKPVELGTDLVLRASSDRMAYHTFFKRLLAGSHILRQTRSGRSYQGHYDQKDFCHRAPPVQLVGISSQAGFFDSNTPRSNICCPWVLLICNSLAQSSRI